MEGLKKQIPDGKERRNHIIHNMLYMSELNAKNVFICKHLIFGKDCNIHEGDTLQLDTKKEWGISHFGLTVANPPYQDASGNKGAGHKLWEKFVVKVNESVIEGGYIGLIHPPLWRKANHKTRKIILSNDVLHLEMHDQKKGAKTFGAKTRYDWYVSKRVPYNGSTTMVGGDGEAIVIDLEATPFIPSSNFKFVQSLMAKDNDGKVEIIDDRSNYGNDKPWVVKERDDEHPYPCAYMVKKNNEPILRWSSKNDDGHFGIPKVIFGKATAQGAFVDEKGEYGTTQYCAAIVDQPANLPFIAQAITSNRFRNFCLDDIGVRNEINVAALRYFRKDFWKEFLE